MRPASRTRRSSSSWTRRRTGADRWWGTASADLNATLLSWPQGERTPEHVNAERDVLLVVVAGGATLRIDGVEYGVKDRPRS